MDWPNQTTVSNNLLDSDSLSNTGRELHSTHMKSHHFWRKQNFFMRSSNNMHSST